MLIAAAALHCQSRVTNAIAPSLFRNVLKYCGAAEKNWLQSAHSGEGQKAEKSATGCRFGCEEAVPDPCATRDNAWPPCLSPRKKSKLFHYLKQTVTNPSPLLTAFTSSREKCEVLRRCRRRCQR